MTYRAKCEGRRSERARKVARRERQWERFGAQLKALGPDALDLLKQQITLIFEQAPGRRA